MGQEITYEFQITTIVVTHDMNSVMAIGDHVIFMFKGKKLWDGVKEDIADTDVAELQDFMFANILMKAVKKGI